MADMRFFKFYQDSFLAATRMLSRAHQAYYALLLIELYADGVDRMPVEKLKRRTKLRGKTFDDWLAALVEEGCVEVVDGQVVQARVGEEIEQFSGSRAPRKCETSVEDVSKSVTRHTLFDTENAVCVQHATADFPNEINGGHVASRARARERAREKQEQEQEQRFAGARVREGGEDRDGEPGGVGRPAGAAPWVDLIAAFDAAIVAAFGPAMARLCPTASDATTAKRLHDGGATAEDVRRVAGAVLARRAANGQQPPGSMAYIAAAVEEDRQSRRRLGTAAVAAEPKAPPSMRARCLAWANGAPWPPQLGPAPGEDGCAASAADMAFAAGSSSPDRDHGRCALLARLAGVEGGGERPRLAVVGGTGG